MRSTDHLDPSFRHQHSPLWLSLEETPNRLAVVLEPPDQVLFANSPHPLRRLESIMEAPTYAARTSGESHHNPNSGCSSLAVEERGGFGRGNEGCRFRAGWRNTAPATVSLAYGIQGDLS